MLNKINIKFSALAAVAVVVAGVITGNGTYATAKDWQAEAGKTIIARKGQPVRIYYPSREELPYTLLPQEAIDQGLTGGYEVTDTGEVFVKRPDGQLGTFHSLGALPGATVNKTDKYVEYTFKQKNTYYLENEFLMRVDQCVDDNPTNCASSMVQNRDKLKTKTIGTQDWTEARRTTPGYYYSTEVYFDDQAGNKSYDYYLDFVREIVVTDADDLANTIKNVDATIADRKDATLVKNYETALANAKAVLANNQSTQKQIDDANVELQKAIEALKNAPIVPKEIAKPEKPAPKPEEQKAPEVPDTGVARNNNNVVLPVVLAVIAATPIVAFAAFKVKKSLKK